MSWRDEAACLDSGHDFADESPYLPVLRRICAHCPVKDDCLREAIERDEWGVWGGTTTAERRLLARGVRACLDRCAGCGTPITQAPGFHQPRRYCSNVCGNKDRARRREAS